MKKLFFTLVLTLLVGTASTFAQGNYPPDAALIGKAKAALTQSDCNVNNGSGTLQANVTTVSACFAGGFIKRVTVYETPNCPPNQICPLYIRLVGVVEFGCDGDIINVNCGFVSL